MERRGFPDHGPLLFGEGIPIARQNRQALGHDLDIGTGAVNVVAGFVVPRLGNRTERDDGQVLAELQIRGAGLQLKRSRFEIARALADQAFQVRVLVAQQIAGFA